MERINPTPEQEEAIVKMVWEPSGAVLNASTMGAGKTVKAVETVLRRGDKVVLLIAPLGTRLGWKTTFERQGNSLPFPWVLASKEGKHYLTRWLSQEEGIYVVGREYIGSLGWD